MSSAHLWFKSSLYILPMIGRCGLTSWRQLKGKCDLWFLGALEGRHIGRERLLVSPGGREGLYDVWELRDKAPKCAEMRKKVEHC